METCTTNGHAKACSNGFLEPSRVPNVAFRTGVLSHRSCEEFPASRHITMLPHVPKRLPQAIQAFTAQISATPTLQSPSHCFLISKRFRSSSLPPVAMTPPVARPLVVSGTVRFSAGPATDLNILLVSLSLSLCLLI